MQAHRYGSALWSFGIRLSGIVLASLVYITGGYCPPEPPLAESWLTRRLLCVALGGASFFSITAVCLTLPNWLASLAMPCGAYDPVRYRALD